MTERDRLERELHAARDQLRALAESIADGLLTLDADRRLLSVNAAAERVLGWTSPELEGRPLDHILKADGVFACSDGSLLQVAYTETVCAAGSIVVFRDSGDRRDLEALTWTERINHALEHDRFVLHAQPIIDVATGETVQHELLIRMLDADGSLVPPGMFLPAAERYGLIRAIDRWVIGRAAELAAAGHAVEINLSAESLGDASLLGFVKRTMLRHGADPSLILFELTETALIHNEELACGFIEQLAQLGCKVALDDFGTGYGGFRYLKRLPVDALKIDVEFVRDLPHDVASQHVVHAVVDLARGFGLKCVAEGVEDEQTLELLREYGVDYAQGYAIGRPAPLSETLGAPPIAA